MVPMTGDRVEVDLPRGGFEPQGRGWPGLAGRLVFCCLTNGVFVRQQKALPHNEPAPPFFGPGIGQVLDARARGVRGEREEVRGGCTGPRREVPRPLNPLQQVSCALPGGPCAAAGLG